jgi:hypothetical protein
MQETRTAGLAADRLRTAGYEVTTGVGKTGVVGLLPNSDGPTVMLRADMDALPIEEATGLPYATSQSIASKAAVSSSIAPCRVVTEHVSPLLVVGEPIGFEAVLTVRHRPPFSMCSICHRSFR